MTQFIECPCGARSFNPGDIKNGYCVKCKKTTNGEVKEYSEF